MRMQVSCCVHTEVSSQVALWEIFRSEELSSLMSGNPMKPVADTQCAEAEMDGAFGWASFPEGPMPAIPFLMELASQLEFK